jgi:alkaline phosphatase D
MRAALFSLFVVVLTCASAALAQPDNYGQFAPPDAFEDGSPLAYYGSENEWSRRQFTAERAEQEYKRRGQRHILLIMDGQAQQAAKSCRKFLAKDPDDLESLFALSVAQCQLGETDGAFETMKQAVEAGLPFERFVAGPRDLLAPLSSSAAFEKYRFKHSVRLIHGPMLGAMTHSSAQFWVRTADESKVTVQVFAPESHSRAYRTASERSLKANDYTGVVLVDGLEPDTQYSYRVAVDGIWYPSKGHAFRTFPTPGAAAKFSVAFGGCAGYAPENERMWDTIRSFDPAALLMLGDNVYIDLAEEAGPLHRYTYYQRQSRPEFRRLIRSVPVFATWDDHDAAIDDAWLGPYRERPAWKPSMLKLQQENWNNPAYGDAEWPGCWFKFAIGNVEFFVLDCRYYRTNPFAEERTMLGPVQKTWLLKGLKESAAEFKVIASSVAWASGAKPGSRDTWDGFPEEREEIFSAIADHKIDGVLLLSADRHRSEAWKIPRPNAYPLYDLLSARLTNTHRHDLVPGTLFDYNDKCSFGMLSFDSKADDPQVKYQIVSIDGEIVHALTIKKSALTMRDGN